MTQAGQNSRVRTTTGLTLLVLSLLWLAREMWAAHASIARNIDDPTVVISAVALALPAVIIAALVAGVAGGLIAASRLGEPTRGVAAIAKRIGLTAAAGLLIGLVAGGVIIAAYGSGSAIRGLAVTTAVAALVGGALAALAPVPAVAAGVTGTLVVFLSEAVLTLFQSPLKSLFGAGDTVSSQSAAAARFAFFSAVVGGLAAGIAAYVFLRRAGAARWPMYLLAGATPGLLYAVAELIIQLGGARLLRLASGFSTLDDFTINYLRENRINFALAVGFIGGLVAMVAFGRTLRPAEDPAEDPAEEPAESVDTEAAEAAEPQVAQEASRS